MNKQEALQKLADEIAPVVAEYIQETIAWQTDGNEYTESLTNDRYLEFVNELRNKIIKSLDFGIKAQTSFTFYRSSVFSLISSPLPKVVALVLLAA